MLLEIMSPESYSSYQLLKVDPLEKSEKALSKYFSQLDLVVVRRPKYLNSRRRP